MLPSEFVYYVTFSRKMGLKLLKNFLTFLTFLKNLSVFDVLETFKRS